MRAQLLSSLILLAGVTACGEDVNESTNEDEFDTASLEVPFGKIGLITVASPANGGTTNVSASSLGGSCAGVECAVDPFSNVTLTAAANPGFQFAGWSGCSLAALAPQQPTFQGTAVFGETCTANFTAVAVQPPQELTVTLSVPGVAGSTVQTWVDGQDWSRQPIATWRGPRGSSMQYYINVPIAGNPLVTAIAGCSNTQVTFTGLEGDEFHYRVDVFDIQSDMTCTATTTAGVHVYAAAHGSSIAPTVTHAGAPGGCNGWGGFVNCVVLPGTVSVSPDPAGFQQLRCQGTPALAPALEDVIFKEPHVTVDGLPPGGELRCYSYYE